MPATISIENVQAESGRNSRFMYGEQANWADETVGSMPAGRAAAVIASGGAKSGGDLYKYLPKLDSLAIMQAAAETYNLNALDGFDDESRYLAPALNVEGNMGVILSLEGSAPFLANITQDLTPTETAIAANTGGVSTSTVSLTSTSEVSVGVTAATQGVRLTFTVTGGTADGETTGLIIRGVNSDGDPVIETLSWLNGALNEAQTTQHYYTTGTLTAQPIGWTAGSAAVAVTDNNGTVVRFNPRSGPIRRFLTAEASIGDVPHRFYGLCMSNCALALDRSSRLMLSGDWIGRRALLYSAFGDDDAHQDNPTRTPLPGTLSEANEDAYVGWQGVAHYGGISLPMRSVNIGINPNYIFTDGLAMEPYQVSAPVADGKREVSLSMEFIYDKRNNWDEYFENASYFDNMVIDIIAKARGQFREKIRFVARRSQIISAPSGTATGTGPIYQTAEFRCVRPPGTDSAYYLEGTYQDYDRVRQYT